MIEEFGGGVGVRSWASILDEKTREQAEQTALLPILMEPIAPMADAHLGYGAVSGPRSCPGRLTVRTCNSGGPAGWPSG